MEQRLEKIRLGIKKLQELRLTVESENKKLKLENVALQEKLEECKKSKALVADQNVLGNIAGKSASDDIEKKQMKLRINELVREVDKCIALLNQ